MLLLHSTTILLLHAELTVYFILKFLNISLWSQLCIILLSTYYLCLMIWSMSTAIIQQLQSNNLIESFNREDSRIRKVITNYNIIYSWFYLSHYKLNA